MSDDPAKIILGDTAISAMQERGLFGRRRKDRSSQTPPRFTHCENCGDLLHGDWCARCGQPAIDYRRSFRHVIVDLLDSFLNWDSKFFTTIGLLVTRPWRLTNAFLAGQRVRYLHPARLYLLVSIAFFFAATYGIKHGHFQPLDLSPGTRAEIRAELEQENVAPEVRQRVEQALGGKPVSADKRAELESKLEEPDLPKVARDAIEEQLNHGEPQADAFLKLQRTLKDLPPDARDKVQQALQKAQGKTVLFKSDKDDRPNEMNDWFTGRAREKFGEHGTNIQLFLVTLMSNLPYMILACIPLFALVLKILYLRKRIFYIDHLVYAFHIHSFAFLNIMLIVLITLGLKRTIPSQLAGWLIAAMWVAFAVQIFLSIRRVYKQGWFWSVVKFFVGGLVYLTVLMLALVTTFLITIALP